MKVCAVFCEDQKRALKLLSDKQRDSKDQRLAQILQVTCHMLNAAIHNLLSFLLFYYFLIIFFYFYYLVQGGIASLLFVDLCD